jgi:hypothetical protein
MFRSGLSTGLLLFGGSVRDAASAQRLRPTPRSQVGQRGVQAEARCTPSRPPSSKTPHVAMPSPNFLCARRVEATNPHRVSFGGRRDTNLDVGTTLPFGRRVVRHETVPVWRVQRSTSSHPWHTARALAQPDELRPDPNPQLGACSAQCNVRLGIDDLAGGPSVLGHHEDGGRADAGSGQPARGARTKRRTPDAL